MEKAIQREGVFPAIHSTRAFRLRRREAGGFEMRCRFHLRAAELGKLLQRFVSFAIAPLAFPTQQSFDFVGTEKAVSGTAQIAAHSSHEVGRELHTLDLSPDPAQVFALVLGNAVEKQPAMS